LICWTAIDPLTYTRQIGDGTDFWNREIESYGSCQSNDKALAFLLPLAFINFAAVAAACWQAFQARNLESEFAESKYIALSVASLFQAFLTALPILAVVRDEPRSFYVVLVLTFFILSEGILLLIFLPKMSLAKKYAGMTAKQQKMAIAARIKASTKGSGSRGTGSSSFELQQGEDNSSSRYMAEAAHMAVVSEEAKRDCSFLSNQGVDGSLTNRSSVAMSLSTVKEEE